MGVAVFRAISAALLISALVACAGTPRGGLSAPENAPRFVAPVDGVLTSGFSAGGPGVRKHDGVDLGKPYDTPVLASAAGRVARIGPYGNYGLVVIIDHGKGWRTLYAHLSMIHVREGHVVSAGQMIGQVGTTGNATGPHVHFEIQHRDRYLNPELFMELR